MKSTSPRDQWRKQVSCHDFRGNQQVCFPSPSSGGRCGAAGSWLSFPSAANTPLSWPLSSCRHPPIWLLSLDLMLLCWLGLKQGILDSRWSCVWTHDRFSAACSVFVFTRPKTSYTYVMKSNVGVKKKILHLLQAPYSPLLKITEIFMEFQIQRSTWHDFLFHQLLAVWYQGSDKDIFLCLGLISHEQNHWLGLGWWWRESGCFSFWTTISDGILTLLGRWEAIPGIPEMGENS